MQLLKILEKVWKFIILNFIIKLFLFKDLIININYNNILIIINRLTKYAYFINYLKAFNAENLIYTFLRIIFANHDILAEILFNQDKLFTFKFWKSLINQLKIKHRLLIVYYSQINKQTKRINQILKQYLQYYINYRQNN